MKHVRFSTPRLIVRDLPPRAGAAVARFHRESWDFHRRWEPFRPHDYFTSRVQRRILRSERRADGTLHLWMLLPQSRRGVVWGRSTIVGSVSVSSIIRGFFQNCFLGYKVDARYARQGYTREALGAVLDYLFNDLGLHRVEANVMPANGPSQALLRSLGFREEGRSPAYLQIQGVWEDHLHFVMLRERWNKNRLRP